MPPKTGCVPIPRSPVSAPLCNVDSVLLAPQACTDSRGCPQGYIKRGTMSVVMSTLPLRTVCAFLVFALGTGIAAAQQPLRIAVLAPMSGTYAGSGQAMVAGARLQARRINARGGVGGRKLEIVVYNTRADPERAAALAAEIAASDAIAAVGAYFSSVSLEAAPVFKRHGVPAVTGSATAPRLTAGNPWYFRVVPANDVKGRFIALYISGILQKDKVHIVYEDDAYGRTLYRAFARTARDLGLNVGSVWRVDSSSGGVRARLDRIVAALARKPEAGALFIALLGEEAARLVRRLRKAGVGLTLVGGDAVGLSAFRRTFAQFDDPAYTLAEYLDGIYATTYFIRGVANQKAQRFANAFQRRYGQPPGPLAATHYDAVGIIAAALQGTAVERGTAALRRQVRSGLQSFDSLETAYKGVTGLLYFNNDGDVVKPSTFGIYAQSRLISAPAQLTPVVHPKAVANLARLREQGEVVSMGSRLYFRTDVVYTGIDVNQVREIDTKAGTFTIDFYLWFRYRAAFEPRNVQFINAAESVQLGEPVAKMDLGALNYQAFRVSGTFDAEFDFHDFPFDRQMLTVRLRHEELQSERLRFVTDDIGMRRGAGTTPLRRARRQGVLSLTSQWRLVELLVFTDTSITESTLGNPALFQAGADTQISHSRFNLLIGIERLTSSYVLNNLAPLFFVLVLGYAMLYVPFQGAAFVARINLGVIALLTTVSFSLKTSRQLPGVSYLVLLDYLYFMVYLLLLTGIVTSIVKYHWLDRGYHTAVKRLQLATRVLLPSVLLIAVALAVLLLR